jgi:glycerate kinase
LLDKNDRPLTPQPQNLPFIHRLSYDRVLPLPRIVAACDVENPLLGPRGTAQVFAPQKGATPATVFTLSVAFAALGLVSCCILAVSCRSGITGSTDDSDLWLRRVRLLCL